MHEKENIYCINHYCCYDLDLQSDSICRRRCCGSSGKYLNSAQSQIKTIVNNVVFPVIDVILAILLFAKLGMLYSDYRKHGQIEWTAPAILFGCLIFTLTAPLYLWSIVGM